MYQNILAEMARNNMTREEVANKLNLSVPALRGKLIGKVDFKISEIKKLLSLFGKELTFEYLFQQSN